MNKPGRHLEAFVGHMLDLYRLCTFQLTQPYSYSKFRFINSVRRRTGARQLIETGTYLGVTTNRCAPHFEKVYTIELDKGLAKNAAEFLRRRKNVEVIQGDGLVQLPKVLARPDVHDVEIFLDGHYSGPTTAMGDQAEPACDELTVIARYRDKVRTIIIDDFRCMGVFPGCPKKSEILRSIEQNFPEGFETFVQFDQVIILRKP